MIVFFFPFILLDKHHYKVQACGSYKIGRDGEHMVPHAGSFPGYTDLEYNFLQPPQNECEQEEQECGAQRGFPYIEKDVGKDRQVDKCRHQRKEQGRPVAE